MARFRDEPIPNFERWVGPMDAFEPIFGAARLALQPEIKVEGTEIDWYFHFEPSSALFSLIIIFTR